MYPLQRYDTEWSTQWVKDGTGMMASKWVFKGFSSYQAHYSHLIWDSGVEAGIKLRPNEKELGDIGPAFTARWKEFFVPAPDKPVLLMGTIALFVVQYTLVAYYLPSL